MHPKLQFVSSVPVIYKPSQSALSKLPRALRKAMHKTVAVPATYHNINTHDGVDSYMRTDCRTDTYHTQNLEFLDRPYDFDEFGDIDNEFDGLTIHEPMNEIELFEFCTGYNII